MQVALALDRMAPAATVSRRTYHASSAEDAVEAALLSLGVALERECTVDDSPWRFDFGLPQLGIVLDVHGCYWHGCYYCPYGASRALHSNHAIGVSRHMLDDQRKAAHAERWLDGWAYRVIWEHDIYGLRGPGRGRSVSAGLPFVLEQMLGPRWATVTSL